MPNALQDLRKAAGFDTAKAFAAEMGIPETTYARYERDPRGIPLEPAWKLADRLGCTIDAVVGRAEPDPMAARGEVQRRYDALSGQSRALFDDFLEFVEARDKKAAKEEDEVERARYRRFAAYYESLMYKFAEWGADVDPQAFEDLIFATEDEKRDQLEEFIWTYTAKRRADLASDSRKAYEEELNKKSSIAVEMEDGSIGVVDFFDPRFDDEVERRGRMFYSAKAKELDEQDGEVIGKIMAAYDEMHDKS